MHDYTRNSHDDQDMCDLLRAQTAPPRWVVYRVLRYAAHNYQLLSEIGSGTRFCAICPLPREAHRRGRDLRMLLLLVNGPLRNMTWLTNDDSGLPANARNWRHTLFNIAEAAGLHIDGWAAYDGRGQE